MFSWLRCCTIVTHTNFIKHIAVHWKQMPCILQSLTVHFFRKKNWTLDSCYYHSLDFHCQRFLHSLSSIWTDNSLVPAAHRPCFLFSYIILVNAATCYFTKPPLSSLYPAFKSFTSHNSPWKLIAPSLSPQGPNRTWSMTSGAWFGRRTATASWWSPNWWRWGEWVE